MRGFLAVVVLGLSVAGCGSGGGDEAISFERDYWGHRPGPKGFTTVILDAGHGGKDSGAVSRTTGAKEKELALDTAQRIRKKLGGKVKVVMMRGGDSFVDLDDRVDQASKKDGAILLSIHYNAGPSHLRGPETYWWRVDSYGLATRCQQALEKAVPRPHDSRGQVRRRLRLTRNPNIPSVLLEFGYLSNPSEARLCNDPGYRDKLASAIAGAILDQQRLGDPPGKLPKPINKPPSRPTDPPGS
ncbi:N-acetylmuramoyl-L-alanine amidase family protein [Haloferula sp.]|uniref:N-acetylmuramoyl-L-alanine amidase family protein n=1 Tax=Haloferula sp. TaxID=2497595 RepID=UPI0032A068EF